MSKNARTQIAFLRANEPKLLSESEHWEVIQVNGANIASRDAGKLGIGALGRGGSMCSPIWRSDPDVRPARSAAIRPYVSFPCTA